MNHVSHSHRCIQESIHSQQCFFPGYGTDPPSDLQVSSLPLLLAPGGCIPQQAVLLLFISPWLQKLQCPANPTSLPPSLPRVCRGKLLHCICQTQAQLHREHYWPCATASCPLIKPSITTVCLRERCSFPKNKLSQLNLLSAVSLSHLSWI